MDEKKSHKNETSARVSTTSVGIWTILTMKEAFSLKPFSWFDWEKYASATPYVYRLVRDVYGLNPSLVAFFLVSKVWKAIEPGIKVYISSRLYTTLETGLWGGSYNPRAVIWALIAHLVCLIVSTLSSNAQNYFVPKLTAQTTMFFHEHLMRENLKYDVQTLQLNKTNTPEAYSGWFAFSEICDVFTSLLSMITILGSILSQSHGGSFFTILCLLYPLGSRTVNSKWSQAMVLFSDNADYIRIQALTLLSSETFREEIVNNNLSEHIIDEYAKSRKRLGASYVENPIGELRFETKIFLSVFRSISWELPLIYFTYCAILDPASHSLSTLAILRQQSTALTSSVESFFSMLRHIIYTLDTIKGLYHVEKPRLIDGSTDCQSSSMKKGMSFDFQDVSFSYPGTKSKEGALQNVSLQIKAGQLVVIVGANGSGKSTLIKLLTRMYDVSSGQLLVDGLPIQEYKQATLRDAIAILNQDSKLYPLTLAENIGLGYSACYTDSEMIMESLNKGRATEVVAGLKQGLETTLEPVKTATGYRIDKEKQKELQDILDKLEVVTTVSGGEKQRLAASRTFMRLQSPKIRFVAVDEPSSALDPKGELELFNQLRFEQAGRTMIFVTHRFGHLTKYADRIICMKNGQVVESGIHKDLLAMNGEYATLYNIQAQAFARDAETGLATPPNNDE